MIMQMDPKDIFPKMPQEVFDMWITPLILDNGWPFHSTNCSVQNTRWEHLFADLTLGQWADCEFKLVKFPLSSLDFKATTWLYIDGIIDHCTAGAHTRTANLKNTQERFRACAEFILTNKRLPLPIMGIFRGGGWMIVDGHHRIAAAIWLAPAMDCDIIIPIWQAMDQSQ
jgi:hypothetical protein